MDIENQSASARDVYEGHAARIIELEAHRARLLRRLANSASVLDRASPRQAAREIRRLLAFVDAEADIAALAGGA